MDFLSVGDQARTKRIQLFPEGALIAEAGATVVPHLHQHPIRLEFIPITESDAHLVLSLYGKELGQRILSHCFPNTPPIDRSRTVMGCVTSESGKFHGRIDVMATNPVLGLWRRGVTWKQEDSGHWVGTFEFTELDEGEHHFVLSAGPEYEVESKRARATPPHEFERGHFIVRDLVNEVPPKADPHATASGQE